MINKDPEKITERDLPCSFGPFEIIATIGEGGMARVFQAKRRNDKEHSSLALKIIRSSLLRQNPNLSKNLKSVVEKAITLDHPNVIDIIEYGVISGIPYFEMAFQTGIGMAELLKSNQRPTPWQILEIAAQTCDGLAYIHNHDNGPTIHRDIKPSNLYLNAKGQILLLDAGISQAGQADSGSNQTGMSKGELGFFSPEQFNSEQLVKQTDLFCVGLLMYELCTQERLLPVQSLAKFINALGNIEKYVENQRIKEHINQHVNGLGDIVLLCLKENPIDRIESANRLAKELRKLQTHHDENPLSDLVLQINPLVQKERLIADETPINRPDNGQKPQETPVDYKPFSPRQKSKPTKDPNEERPKPSKKSTQKIRKSTPSQQNQSNPAESTASDISWPIQTNETPSSTPAQEEPLDMPASVLKPKSKSKKPLLLLAICFLPLLAVILIVTIVNSMKSTPESQTVFDANSVSTPSFTDKAVNTTKEPISQPIAKKNTPGSFARDGWSAVNAKEIDRARTLFNKALSMNSNLTDALRGIAYCDEYLSMQTKDKTRSKQFKTKALKRYRKILSRKKLSPPLSELDRLEIEGKVKMLASELQK